MPGCGEGRSTDECEKKYTFPSRVILPAMVVVGRRTARTHDRATERLTIGRSIPEGRVFAGKQMWEQKGLDVKGRRAEIAKGIYCTSRSMEISNNAIVRGIAKATSGIRDTSPCRMLDDVCRGCTKMR